MIRFEGIYKKYKNAKTEILEDLNFRIHDGDFIILRGEKGKSTLLRFIYMMDKPTSGDIFYNEDKMSKYRFSFQKAKLRRKIAYADEQIWLLEDRTVYQNIKISVDLLKIKNKERIERVEKIINYFDLGELQNLKASQLSMQEKVLVILARELIKKPEVVILDEVFEKLKKENKDKLLNYLYKLNDERKTVIIVVSKENIFNESIVKNVYLSGGKINVESDQ